MVFVSNLASLNLVKEELDASLSAVETHITAYVDDRENQALLATCVENLEQIKGVLQVIELQGAIELAHALTQLVKRLQENGQDASDDSFAAIGQGIMMLGRYLEYTQLSHHSWPQLLLPTINQVRVALGQTLLNEGVLLSITNFAQPAKVTQLNLDPSQLNVLVRRLRLMYQTGLIAVLRDSAESLDFRMMKRACERAQQICSNKPQSLLWWIASILFDALEEGVMISALRKKLLSQLDRLLRDLAQNDGNGKLDKTLVADCLFVISLADTDKYDAIKKVFGIEGQVLTESAMATEYEAMCGPGGSVIKTVANVLKDELAIIKDTLDIMSRGSKNDSNSFATLSDNLNRISQTLVMLGLLESGQRSKSLADYVRQWNVIPEEGQLYRIVDVLMEVESDVANLVRRVTVANDTKPENAKVSIHQLDEANALLVAETRSGLSLVKRAVSAYLESEKDNTHLMNVPVTLASVSGGVKFLGSARGEDILRRCSKYIQERLLDDEYQPAMSELETFADIISSVDYYLESLETNKPVGEAVLEIAEDGLTELGITE